MSQNIKPSVWGPHGWKFMHFVSLGYPDDPSQEDKRLYKEFYESLQHILPCGACAQNYKLNLQEMPIDNALDSRDTLIKWVIDIHNKVNQETGKKTLDHEEALNLYPEATESSLRVWVQVADLSHNLNLSVLRD